MSLGYITRSLESVVREACKEFPAVVLTGPRQSGKTTLLRELFSGSYQYVSLEPPDVMLAASNDPRGFVETYPPPVIFDEAQYAPVLLPYIKEKIDSARHKKGQYILTGSQNLLLMKGVTESLAGRAAILRLLPLSMREVAGRPGSALPWEKRKPQRSKDRISREDIWSSLLAGGYPEIALDPKRDASLWHASYIQTYLERDVRGIRQIGDLTQFQSFLRLLASRSAQLVNLTDLSRDLGIAVNTVKAWLSVLEASYQIITLRPYFANIGKRLVKTPKVYFSDVGTLCYLVGLRDPDHASSGPMGGAIIETAVLAEIVRRLTHRGIEPEIYFWRTSSGSEVDIVLSNRGKLIPLEVKLSATPRPVMASGIRSFRHDLGAKAASGYVIHPGSIELPLGPGVSALPLRKL
jgi:predicted AAA+ superfamily ATPase